LHSQCDLRRESESGETEAEQRRLTSESMVMTRQLQRSDRRRDLVGSVVDEEVVAERLHDSDAARPIQYTRRRWSIGDVATGKADDRLRTE
jgi:hypothetical protein